MEQFSLFPSVQCNIQVIGMLPASTPNRHKSLAFQKQVQLHRASAVTHLVYHFLPPNDIQQNELIAIVRGRVINQKPNIKGHRWQRYNITAKAGECGTILGLPGFMWSLHCKLKNKTKKLEIIIKKKEKLGAPAPALGDGECSCNDYETDRN